MRRQSKGYEFQFSELFDCYIFPFFFVNLYIALNCKHFSSFFSDEECGDCIDADKRPHKIARWQALKENS